jgi:hypothetical protein
MAGRVIRSLISKFGCGRLLDSKKLRVKFAPFLRVGGEREEMTLRKVVEWSCKFNRV